MYSDNHSLEREAKFISNGEQDFKQVLQTLQEGEAKVTPRTNEEVSKLDDEIAKLRERLKLTKERRLIAQRARVSISKELHSARLLRDAITEKTNSLSFESTCLRDHVNSMKEECLRVSMKLKKYMKINVTNDAFYIWYSGPFGTINNFRLGTLPIKQIDWSEINAAFGQAVLAVSFVATKAGYEFKKFKLSPMGSFPKVYKADDLRTPMSLSYDGSGFSLFPKQTFNKALMGFLTCLQELADYTRSKDPTLSLPYVINVAEGKIHDHAVNLGADDETWTRALKFLLADIKWILAWGAKHCSNNHLKH